MVLCRQTIPNVTPKDWNPMVHRIFVIDCSGSMSYELPMIREQMKNKIPQLTRVGDSVTIIWFSARGECGVLQEGLLVKSVKDFNLLNNAIDRFLRPIGLTGFKDPIDLAASTAEKLKEKYKDSIAHMMFMTDGGDNCWRHDDIFKSLALSLYHIDSVTFVEYGWYCDRALITKMAELVGANQVFSEDFDRYDGVFENNLVQAIGNTKRIEVSLPKKAELGFCFSFDGQDIFTYLYDDKGVVRVPESTKELFFFKDKPAKGDDVLNEGSPLYASLVVLAQRMLTNAIYDILGTLGDVYLIDLYSNCFSKQDYSKFQEASLKCAQDPSAQYLKGKDLDYIPAENCFTVIDLLDELASSKENMVYIYSPDFRYERISAARVNADSVVSEKEKAELLKALSEAKDPAEIKEISDKLAALAESKVALKFEPHSREIGYPISSLTFNESRPNISILFRIPGTISLDGVAPPELGLPSNINTFITRNYAVVKDGIKHSSLYNFPVSLGRNSYDFLVQQGVLGENVAAWEPGRVFLLDVSKLPVINRRMTKEVSAQAFFSMVAELQMYKSHQKVFNSLLKNGREEGEVYADLSMVYGEEAAAWLNAKGVTTSGFSPKTVKGADSVDMYMAKEFKVSLAKYSSIPTISEAFVMKVAQTPEKLTASEALCAKALLAYWDHQRSDKVKNSEDPAAVTKAWLEEQQEIIKKMVRGLIREIAKIKFTIIVGHTWFKEFQTLEENSMVVEVQGTQFSCKAELKEVKVFL